MATFHPLFDDRNETPSDDWAGFDVVEAERVYLDPELAAELADRDAERLGGGR